MTSPSTTTVRSSARDDGPYVLRPWVDPVPLSVDGSQDGIKINCVEYYDGNLYVGTSASELLHFVRLPPDPADKFGKPTFILASRLTPVFSENAKSQPGVQQILLLPRVGKACILCNRTVTFYSLPELTPSGTREVNNCNWIGGVDLNESDVEDEASGERNSIIILLSTNRRIQVVQIEDGVRAIKNIDFAGSTLSVRRDSIACVADAKTYALIDVGRQLKIPLMSISSLDDGPSSERVSRAQSIPSNVREGKTRSASSAQSPRPQASTQSRSRSKSTGGTTASGTPPPQEVQASPDVLPLPTPTPPSQPSTPQPPGETESTSPPADKPLPPAPKPQQGSILLKPHIASPTSEEFLLVIGTSPTEPSVGMFINLDGDPTRPTITFSCYPKEMVVDGNSSKNTASSPVAPQQEEEEEEEVGYVLASMVKGDEGTPRYGIEIQHLDAGSEAHPELHWLEADDDATDVYGIRSLTNSHETYFEEVVEQLSMCKFVPFAIRPTDPESSSPTLKTTDSRTALSIERLTKERELFERDHDSNDEEPLPEGWEAARTREGEEFALRLAKAQTRLAVWSGSRIWWAVRNPLIVQLNAKLEAACTGPEQIDRRAVVVVLSAIQGREPKTELEFTTIGYIQQKAGVLLLTNLLLSSVDDGQFSSSELVALEEVLVESKLDPRVVLSLIPGVRNEIIEGRQGIWVYGGVKKTPETLLRSKAFYATVKEGIEGLEPKILHFLRRYLHAWRRMKGFGSVPVESEVFQTVDAALLLVLLELDKNSPKGLGRGGTARAELNELVDGGMDCFDRATILLRAYHRLFVLSRLYQSRKMAAEVLATWRRIVEGEEDAGQELRDGEQRIKDYLTKIGNRALVQEYGLWLANRNPKLGVQVFAEDKGKTKFEPAQAVELLRREAPGAVRYYLEHLVFGKGYTAHVNELITYYLDIVIGDLESPESRDRVLAAYDAYRALQAPKPTYRHFLAENAAEDDEVWQSRLRLLQLLGGAHGYDVSGIRERLSSLQDDLLVPESIILDGRERKHEDALRLLVHKLGDYDTAVSYCLRGGASIYSPTLGRGEGVFEVEEQRRLFLVVLHEFLAIDDISDRVQQTGALLERFGGWFDVDDVLRLVPDSWSVDIFAGFLVGALRRLVAEKHESVMTRALTGAENLRVSYDLVANVEERGPSIEASN